MYSTEDKIKLLRYGGCFLFNKSFLNIKTQVCGSIAFFQVLHIGVIVSHMFYLYFVKGNPILLYYGDKCIGSL